MTITLQSLMDGLWRGDLWLADINPSLLWTALTVLLQLLAIMILARRLKSESANFIYLSLALLAATLLVAVMISGPGWSWIGLLTPLALSLWSGIEAKASARWLARLLWVAAAPAALVVAEVPLACWIAASMLAWCLGYIARFVKPWQGVPLSSERDAQVKN